MCRLTIVCKTAPQQCDMRSEPADACTMRNPPLLSRSPAAAYTLGKPHLPPLFPPSQVFDILFDQAKGETQHLHRTSLRLTGTKPYKSASCLPGNSGIRYVRCGKQAQWLVTAACLHDDPPLGTHLPSIAAVIYCRRPYEVKRRTAYLHRTCTSCGGLPNKLSWYGI